MALLSFFCIYDKLYDAVPLNAGFTPATPSHIPRKCICRRYSDPKNYIKNVFVFPIAMCLSPSYNININSSQRWLLSGYCEAKTPQNPPPPLNTTLYDPGLLACCWGVTPFKGVLSLFQTPPPPSPSPPPAPLFNS